MKVPFKRVEVVWDDAETTALGWEHINELTIEPRLAVTIGFLLRENDEHIVISHSADGDANTNGRIQIPVKMIKERREVKTYVPRKPTSHTP